MSVRICICVCALPHALTYSHSHVHMRICVGAHVAKFQLACDHRGTPIFWTGPHIGTVHDMKLWERNPAPLHHRERWLADKAYNKKGHAELIFPHKKPRGGTLTLRQKSFNTGMSWYRTTVEHSIGMVRHERTSYHRTCISGYASPHIHKQICIVAHAYADIETRLRARGDAQRDTVLVGYVKRFRILSSTYRGRLTTHSLYLQRAAKIIICMSALYLQNNPLRTHADLGLGTDYIHVVYISPHVCMRMCACGRAYTYTLIR